MQAVSKGLFLRSALVCGALVGATVTGACERERSPGNESDVTPKSEFSSRYSSDEILSPMETVRRVREHRLSGRLQLLETYLISEQRTPVVELIQSVDRLRWANGVLQAAVTNHLGPATARAFDRSEAANAIGVFSRDVDLLDERVVADRAVVTIQVAGRVPLEEANLVRREGRWLIQTDPPIPGVAEALNKLAQVLVDTARLLDEGHMSAEELQRELLLREASIGRRLETLTSGR